MIVSEKGLARCLNRAYKRNGYTLQQLGEELCIYTEEWFVRLRWRDLPRKALAVMAEHTGYTYIGANALHNRKDMDPQLVMPDVVGEDLAFWIQTDDIVPFHYVPVIVKGRQLYQQVDARECFGVNPDALELLDGMTGVKQTAELVGGDKLRWKSDDETVLIGAYRPIGSIVAGDGEKAVWRALESVDLHPKE